MEACTLEVGEYYFRNIQISRGKSLTTGDEPNGMLAWLIL